MKVSARDAGNYYIHVASCAMVLEAFMLSVEDPSSNTRSCYDHYREAMEKVGMDPSKMKWQADSMARSLYRYRELALEMAASCGVDIEGPEVCPKDILRTQLAALEQLIEHPDDKLTRDILVDCPEES